MTIAKRKRVETILVEALAKGATVAQAGVQGGVSERTVYRYLQKPEFQARIQALQDETLERAMALASAACLDSARSLVTLQEEAHPPSVRRAAARDTLEMGLRLRDDVEMENRLLALEGRDSEANEAALQARPNPPPASKRPRRGDIILQAALAAGANVAQAASKANVHEQTVRRRLQDPTFRQRITQIRAEIVQRAYGMLNSATTLAVKTLIELKSPNTPASVRRLASRDLLEMAQRMRHAVSVEKRLKALEMW